MLVIVYWALCIVGTTLPYTQLIPFLLEHGFDSHLFLEQLFANRISSFFGVDLIVTSIVLWVFILSEGKRLKMNHLWLYLVSYLLVRVSLAYHYFY
jgi:hypothetical protein